ncbi:MAG: ABC transporter permease [Burkholderiaceae bacterium]|nr:ABC transporter permease [Burkholderiaceae bacterium]
MLEFVIRRMFSGLLVILLVSLAIFALARLVPASPALLVLGADAPVEKIREFEAEHGLDRPILLQYTTWMTAVLTQFDFGVSYVSGRPITEEVRDTLPVTLELLIVAMAICLMIAIPLGVISALNRDGIIDHVLRMVAIVGVSTPGFWIGLLMILWLSVKAGWFPPGDLAPITDGWVPHLRSLFLPALSLGLYYTAIISRMTRASVLEVLGQDYVRTAIALGLPKAKIRTSYVLRNALIPIVSVVAMACGYMFGWAIVIEQVFNIPGICRALLAAVFARDYNLVQASVLVITVAFVALNLMADVSYRVLNPKVSW